MDLEDKEIVREVIEESKAKKQSSLFQRKKEGDEPRASLPPGTGPAPGRTSVSSSNNAADDGLPERLALGTQDHKDGQVHALNSDSLATSQAELKEKGSIPTHVGFDIAALKAAAAEAKETMVDDERQLTSQVQITDSSYIPERTEPVPPSTIKSTDKGFPPSPATPTAPTPYRTAFGSSDPHLPGMGGAAELSGAFSEMELAEQRTPSLPPKRLPSIPMTPSSHVDPSYEESSRSRSGQDAAPTPPFADAPTLSFGSADGSVWTPNPAATFSNPGTSSPDEHGFKVPHSLNSNDSSSRFNQPWGSSYAPSPSYSPNVFGGSTYSSNLGSNPFAASSTLSFGAQDGTVSLGTTSSERDPWAPKPIAGGSKKPAYAFNPWES